MRQHTITQTNDDKDPGRHMLKIRSPWFKWISYSQRYILMCSSLAYKIQMLDCEKLKDRHKQQHWNRACRPVANVRATIPAPAHSHPATTALPETVNPLIESTGTRSPKELQARIKFSIEIFIQIFTFSYHDHGHHSYICRNRQIHVKHYHYIFYTWTFLLYTHLSHTYQESLDFLVEGSKCHRCLEPIMIHGIQFCNICSLDEIVL